MQKSRTVLIIRIEDNPPKEVQAKSLYNLVDFATFLTQDENKVLSLAPNQFMLLFISCLQSQSKKSLDHVKLILKAGSPTKMEENLQYYLILAGRHLRLDKFESLADIIWTYFLFRKDKLFSLYCRSLADFIKLFNRIKL